MTYSKVTFTFHAGLNEPDARITLERVMDILDKALSLTGEEIEWRSSVKMDIEEEEE